MYIYAFLLLLIALHGLYSIIRYYLVVNIYRGYIVQPEAISYVPIGKDIIFYQAKEYFDWIEPKYMLNGFTSVGEFKEKGLAAGIDEYIRVLISKDRKTLAIIRYIIDRRFATRALSFFKKDFDVVMKYFSFQTLFDDKTYMITTYNQNESLHPLQRCFVADDRELLSEIYSDHVQKADEIAASECINQVVFFRDSQIMDFLIEQRKHLSEYFQNQLKEFESFYFLGGHILDQVKDEIAQKRERD